jgi:putative redox protein
MQIEIKIESLPGLKGSRSSDAGGNQLIADVSGGGFPEGLRPMQLLPIALANCSIADILLILEKQRQKLESWKINIVAERAAGPLPSLWTTIHLDIFLLGQVEIVKAEKAVKLSVEKYCSVAETLRRAGTKISYSIKINNR